jgi:DNA-binding response OmpR family regulator
MEAGVTEKILIIDDDPDTIEFLTLIMQRLGFQVFEARDGMEALASAHSEKPDLIILDVMMPGLDGFEVARSLRRHPETALTPILMFTAKTQVEDKLAGYEAGVDIYLTKPVHPVELQANIKALLAQRKARTDMLAKRGYVIGVIGSKGGLGASTLALNLAISYHKKFDTGVIVAEMRPGQGSWAVDLELQEPTGLTNLLKRNQTELTPASVEEQLVSTKFGIRMLLASNQSKDVDLCVALAQFEMLVEQLAMLAPVVFLDIGTNFHPAFDLLVRQCNEIILVTEPQPVTIRTTRMLIDDLRQHSFGSGKALTIVAVNRTRAEITLTMSRMEEALKVPVALGIPPATELAYLAATRSLPMVVIQPEGVTAQQFSLLAEHISHHVDS